MPIDLDEYRQASHEVWERIATNWDREREYIYAATGPVTMRMVERVGPQPGDTVLDLAAGTGDTGFLAAAMIGDEGKLISTDFAPAMVEAARGVGTELGLGNVEHRVLDGERMDLDDSSIDRVLCRFGYMLMADPRCGARRDSPRSAQQRAALLCGLDGARREPVGLRVRDRVGRARPPSAARARGARNLRDGRSRTDPRAGHRRGLRRARGRAGGDLSLIHI